jgi:Bcr/CflA subfamily drug resistance transporter
MNTRSDAESLFEQKKWTIRFLLIATMALGTMAADMYVPSLPSIVHSLQTSTSAVKWTLSIYLLGFTSLQVVYGPLSDRFGRRPILLIGFAIGIVGSLICAIAPNIQALLIGRFIQGMGLGSYASLVRSIVQDLYHHNEEKLSKMISSLTMIYSIAPIVAPVFGGYLQHYWGWHSVFIVFFCYLTVLGVIAYFKLPETHLHRNKHALHLPKLLSFYGRMLRTPSFIVFVIISSVSLGGILAYYAISPFLYQSKLNITPIEYGWLALATAVILLLSRGLNILLARRWAISQRFKIGLCFFWSGPFIMMVFALFHYFNIYVILFPYMIFILGSGLVMPNSMVRALTQFNEAKGSAAGLYTLCQLSGVFIISVTASHLTNQTQIGLALLLFTITSISVILYWIYVHYSAYGEK